MGYHKWKTCIDACLDCAALCNHCASACTKEHDVKMMAKCIELDMQCSAICYASAQLMSLGSLQAGQLCAICAEICDACGKECGKHYNQHCRECAEACKHCADECRKMAAWKAAGSALAMHQCYVKDKMACFILSLTYMKQTIDTY